LIGPLEVAAAPTPYTRIPVLSSGAKYPQSIGWATMQARPDRASWVRGTPLVISMVFKVWEIAESRQLRWQG